MTHAAETPVPAESAPWTGWEPSSLSHHGEACCTTARAWFRAMNRSLWRGHDGPTWIARRFPWGPTRWPLHWCEALEAEELDCGAHAALTIEAYRAFGVRVVPVQLVQRQERHHLPHFHGWWAAGSASPAWAGDGVAYHEACATIADGVAAVWDPTVNAWLSADHVRGLRSIVALRLGGTEPSDEVVSWQGLRIPLGEWTSPERASSAMRQPARRTRAPRAAG